MNFGFRKRIRIMPGVYINLNKGLFSFKKTGASLSVRNKYIGGNLNADGLMTYGNAHGSGLNVRGKRKKVTQVPVASGFSKFCSFILNCVTLAAIAAAVYFFI